jgi:NitT/TauT family transport system ATP-binding protein
VSIEIQNGPLLEAREIKYDYPDGTTAVGNVSFTLKSGEVLGIVGPSGCGKSTLLRVMAGLTVATDGSLRFNVDTSESSRPLLTMMFQEETLLPWLRVLENASLYFRFHGDRRSAEAKERVGQLLKMVGLDDAKRLFPVQLSGGMRRRAAFVAAMAPYPRILLLDEPFSSLDEPTRLEIHQIVLRILRDFEMTCCLVTHDLAEAITLCDRIIVLTAAPAVVAATVDIDFGLDRDVFRLRAEPRFLEKYAVIWSILCEQIENGKAQKALESLEALQSGSSS